MASRTDGAMPLAEHLRELRRRLVWSVGIITLALIPAWMYYNQVFTFLLQPMKDLLGEQPGEVELFLGGVSDPFTLQIQVVTVTAIVVTSPFWLLQLWRFITPGLHKRERKWVYLFVTSATPLIALGVWAAYLTLPVGLQLLIGFTPSGVSNLIPVDKYFEFVFRMVLVFCVGFLIPLFLVLLNFADLIRAKTMRKWWRGVTMGVMLFGAVATPTGDPLTMLFVALPILILMVLAWGIAAVNDWRRRKRGFLVDEEQSEE